MKLGRVPTIDTILRRLVLKATVVWHASHVGMLVYSNCTGDARVMRQASAAPDLGYSPARSGAVNSLIRWRYDGAGRAPHVVRE
jgi:hypothetical protein